MYFEYIVLGTLFAAWFGVSLYRTNVAVFLLPLFFPLYLIRFEISGIPIYFVEGLILLTAIPVFYKIFMGHHNDIHDKSIAHKLIYIIKSRFKSKHVSFKDFAKSPFLPLSLFLIACTISTLIVPGELSKQALGILKSWVIIPLVYFVMFYVSAKKTKDVSMALYAYTISALILGLWGLYQAVSGQYGTIDQRVSGPFESANYLAMYISPALLFVAIRFIQTFIHKKFDNASIKWNSVERRIYLSGLVAFLFAVLMLTLSYGAIIGVFGTLFIYILHERFKTSKGKGRTFLTKIIVYALLIFVLGGAITASRNIEKFYNLVKIDEQTSISTRLEIWQVGAQLIKENPILGVGIGQYQSHYVVRATEILGKEPYEPVRLHSHNLILSFWLNSGILGVISFVWLVVLAFMQLKKINNSEDRKLMVAVLGMLTYILLHGMLDVPFWKNDLALLFWLIFSSIFVQVKILSGRR